MTFRTMTVNDLWPTGIVTGFEGMPRHLIQHDWIFVAVENDEIVALLMTSPMHGVVILMRAGTVPGTSPCVLLKLLRYASSIMEERGYHLWVTILDTGARTEKRIMSMSKRWGGSSIPMDITAMLGPVRAPAKIKQQEILQWAS